MPRISTLALPALMAAATIGAVPANAAHDSQRYGASRDAGIHYASFGKAVDLRRDINRLESRIERAYARHRISWREANGLQQRVNGLQRQFRKARRGGLTRWEANRLEARVVRLNRQLRIEMRDGNRRSDSGRRMARRF